MANNKTVMGLLILGATILVCVLIVSIGEAQVVTTRVCDFWADANPHLRSGPAKIMATYRDSLIGLDSVWGGGWGNAFLLHANGTDGDIFGPSSGDTVDIWYSDGFRWLRIPTTEPAIYKELGSQEMFMLAPGDFNGDGLHTIADMLILVNTAFRAGSAAYDITGDCKISMRDVVVMSGVLFRNQPNTMTWGCG